MKFVKMHGLGNDYIVIDLFDRTNSKAFAMVKDLKSFAKKVCDRHFGIGADGILLASPPEDRNNSGRMRIINSDGSEAEMCGNGIRCTAKLLINKGYSKGGKGKGLKIETMSGIKRIVASDGLFRVDMGEPRLLRKEIPMNGNAAAKAINESLQLKYTKVKVTAVSMGNPHAVVFADDANIDIDAFDIEEIGREIENHSAFPGRANVEFVRVLNRNEIELRVWERGVGETLACGTGSCASVVACVLNEKTGREVKVHLKGGDLLVEWAKDNHVYLTGPATYVFSGTVGV
ncbi:diaminopimelate epimerase [Candidatus Woesearchaeota archaeon]|nr:diaminopimelate epimerase [Candidatus Woesearchaeota archaeon]